MECRPYAEDETPGVAAIFVAYAAEKVSPFAQNEAIIQVRQKCIMTPQTVALLFELAVIAETSSRDFYDGLAKKFWHETNISKFWENMAADEAEQVKMMEGLRKSLTSAQLSAPAEDDIVQVALENSKVQIREVLNMVKNLNDAFVLAQLWENSEIYKVFEFLTSQYMPSDADGRFVRLHLTTHKKKLELFSQAFGEAEARKSVSAMDGELLP